MDEGETQKVTQDSTQVSFNVSKDINFKNYHNYKLKNQTKFKTFAKKREKKNKGE